MEDRIEGQIDRYQVPYENDTGGNTSVIFYHWWWNMCVTGYECCKIHISDTRLPIDIPSIDTEKIGYT